MFGDVARFVQGGVVPPRYVPLDVWLVYIASNNANDLNETLFAPKEDYIAAQIS